MEVWPESHTLLCAAYLTSSINLLLCVLHYFRERIGFCQNQGTRFDWTNNPIQDVLNEKKKN